MRLEKIDHAARLRAVVWMGEEYCSGVERRDVHVREVPRFDRVLGSFFKHFLVSRAKTAAILRTKKQDAKCEDPMWVFTLCVLFFCP